MPAEDEAITAVFRIGSTVATSTLDVIKYILQALLARRANGESGALVKVGSALGRGVGKAGTALGGAVYDKATKDWDGHGRHGEVSWKRALGWDDQQTFTVDQTLTDPENIATLKESLGRLGIEYAMMRADGGDTLLTYHVANESTVNDLIAALTREWQKARGVDDDELADELVNDGVVADEKTADDLVDEVEHYEGHCDDGPYTVNQLDRLAGLEQRGFATEEVLARETAEGTVGSMRGRIDEGEVMQRAQPGDLGLGEPATADQLEAIGILAANGTINARELEALGDEPTVGDISLLMMAHSGKQVAKSKIAEDGRSARERTEAVRSQGPEAVMKAFSAESKLDARAQGNDHAPSHERPARNDGPKR